MNQQKVTEVLWKAHDKRKLWKNSIQAFDLDGFYQYVQ